MNGRTVADALRSAKGALATRSHTPGLDAELLLAHALQRPRSFLYAYPGEHVPASRDRRYRALLERRAGGEPLAYIFRRKEFWSMTLEVTPDVLIPRPETELLVELALTRIPQDRNLEIADLGTGSGAIALAIARERPQSSVIACDICARALAVAKANATRLGLNNVTLLLGDWFFPLKARRCDTIVSNPPYIARCDPHLEHDGVCREPRAALVADAQGLGDIRRIATLAPAHLKPGGWLMVEHGYEQGPKVRQIFKKNGFEHVETNRDATGHERATMGSAPSSPRQNAKVKRLLSRRI